MCAIIVAGRHHKLSSPASVPVVTRYNSWKHTLSAESFSVSYINKYVDVWMQQFS